MGKNVYANDHKKYTSTRTPRIHHCLTYIHQLIRGACLSVADLTVRVSPGNGISHENGFPDVITKAVPEINRALWFTARFFLSVCYGYKNS